MSTLVRLDVDHFALLTGENWSHGDALAAREIFNEWWPEKRFLVVSATDFVDLTGQYELVPIPPEMTDAASG